MRIDLNASVCGKMYRLRSVRAASAMHGECDPPNKAKKEIRINQRLSGRALCETVLHELLHASAFDLLSEHYVTHAARDIAAVLWRLGYRVEDPKHGPKKTNQRG